MEFISRALVAQQNLVVIINKFKWCGSRVALTSTLMVLVDTELYKIFKKCLKELMISQYQ